jgi:hypothetical protein
MRWATSIRTVQFLTGVGSFLFTTKLIPFLGQHHIYQNGQCEQFTHRYIDRAKMSFLYSTASRPARGTTQCPIQWILRALSLGVKWPGHEPDHSPLPTAKSRMVVLYLHFLTYLNGMLLNWFSTEEIFLLFETQILVLMWSHPIIQFCHMDHIRASLYFSNTGIYSLVCNFGGIFHESVPYLYFNELR